MWSLVRVDLCNQSANFKTSHDTGTSRAFWYHPVTRQEYYDSRKASPSQISEKVNQSPGGTIVHFKMTATIPFGLKPPAIDSEYKIVLKRVGDQVYYKLLGQHDGFPAHSIFIGNQLIYFYDPIKAGETPFPALYQMDKKTTDLCGECSGSVPLGKAEG